MFRIEKGKLVETTTYDLEVLKSAVVRFPRFDQIVMWWRCRSKHLQIVSRGAVYDNGDPDFEAVNMFRERADAEAAFEQLFMASQRMLKEVS